MREKPGLHPSIAIGTTLTAVARVVLADARHAVGDARRSDARAIHDFRKVMKRWRALLRLVEPELGREARRLRRTARDLAGELSGARDVQSAIEAAEGLAGEHGLLSPRLCARVTRQLADMRTDPETSGLTPERRLHLQAAITAAANSVAHWSLDALDFPEIASEIAGAYRRARRSLPKTWRKADAEILHTLRRHVVVLRYQMELLEPLWPRLGRVWTGEAQRLRDRLGDYNDLAVLASFAARHRTLAPWRARLAPAVAARQADLVKSSARLAARLFAEEPKAFRRRLIALWEANRRKP
ncbi:MAG TPA: CHAD domain-containing protein [Xanthobacteraceae bacterium]|nr:CHAD domain-containing protein [Xanthobacteraceae bacterium]